MVLTDDIHLPSEAETDRQEIPLTHNYFYSSAMWLGKYCDNQCKEFMLCRAEERDPRKCLEYGHKVTDCGFEFFRKVKQTCREELEWYTKCIDYSDGTLRRCRREQALFDGCMKDNGFERAKFGHFQLLRIHDSDRPRPKPYVPMFDDSVESFDIFAEENRQKGPRGIGVRNWFNVWFK